MGLTTIRTFSCYWVSQLGMLAVIAAVAPHDSVERYTELGVEVLQSHARIVDPWTVEIQLNDGGTECLTSRAIVIAAGDVAGPYPFTHRAAHMAWYDAVNALFGDFKKFKVDYSVVPRATFIDPEVAGVGLNEQEAKE